MESEIIKNLREALSHTPGNLPLRLLLAETLLKHGQPAEAETEYKEALRLSPGDLKAKLGLAKAFFGQEKYSAAAVILEELAASANPPAETFLLHARLLVHEKQSAKAAEQYRKALSLDPSLKDETLEDLLKVRRDSETHPEEDDAFEEMAERPKIDFSDVGGMQKVKDEINIKLVLPLQHPELYAAYGKTIGGGLLLYGPPGCGKTHLARATAGQVKARFISVGINDILDMYIGQSEQKMHGLFEAARQNKPCVLFFDEVDALGASRSDMRTSHSRMLINQFLAELDGVNSNNEGLLILGATNAPWHLDNAFRRPGRFDRIIFVPPPDQEARTEILKLQLRGKPQRDVDCAAVAAKTKDYSGADLKALVDAVVEDKLRETLSKGVVSPISTSDLLKAIKTVQPSTREWFSTARNYALYSNESGLYNEVLDYLGIKK